MASQLSVENIDIEKLFVMDEYLSDKPFLEYQVNEFEKNRPDLIAYRIYGSKELDWFVTHKAENIFYDENINIYKYLVLPLEVADIRIAMKLANEYVF